MKTLLYQGYVLTNSEGKTNSWKLSIGDEVRIGSLFELRRQVAFFQELGVLPPVKDYTEAKAGFKPRKPGAKSGAKSGAKAAPLSPRKSR
ncbi:DUF3319 domain-containing protein [Shewanella sp. JM162201]|uniref:DUF3319 domain-containing protein n=1 Tax=Shewanella jiangmenensis TaxID=2837387 RepID=A0ABS5V1A6_9GAMM|nr:DUF3319 domain-containing protein [Shewanella jiangmenensis]MBT1443386.1 DUF3319 domain-containing protein [Shewanella jiangmenensis]